MQHEWVIIWVVTRSARKLVRYFNRIYLDMGFRNEVYAIEWLSITSLTITFPIEYIISVVIVLVTFQVARYSTLTKFTLSENLTLDGSLAYLVLLFVSLPYFLSTLVYLCRKRQQTLERKRLIQQKRRSQRQRSAMAHCDSDASD